MSFYHFAGAKEEKRRESKSTVGDSFATYDIKELIGFRFMHDLIIAHLKSTS